MHLIAAREDGNAATAFAPRTAESTLSTRVVWPLVAALRANQCNPQSILAECGLENASEQDDRIQRRAWYDLLDRSLDFTGNAQLGLIWARLGVSSGGALGLIEYLAKSSPTLGGAVDGLVRYGRLFQDDLAFESANEDGIVRLRLLTSGDTPVPRIWAEGIIAYCYLASRQFIALSQRRPATSLSVQFAHSAPANREPYDTFFKVPVYFDASEHSLAFSAELLDLPLVSADPPLYSLLEGYARRLVAQLPYVGVDMPKRVRTVLLRELDGGNPTKEHVARVLRVSPRTLTRRLASAGTSFEGVLTALRCELAVRYLRDTKLSLSEIAMALGFSGTSSFVRAFRRWTGQSPGGMRLRAERP